MDTLQVGHQGHQVVPRAVQRNTTRRDRHRRQIARGRPPCHLCGEEINYDAESHLDPLAFTIDHIIPLSKTGPEGDNMDNLAAAHRKCNRDKSNGGPEIKAPVTFITDRTW